MFWSYRWQSYNQFRRRTRADASAQVRKRGRCIILDGIIADNDFTVYLMKILRSAVILSPPPRTRYCEGCHGKNLASSVSEFTFADSSVSIANIRVTLGRRLWNAIADVACTGVTCERMDCVLVVCPMAKVRAILIRRLWYAIVDVACTGVTCE
jgi:hypothetical protein